MPSGGGLRRSIRSAGLIRYAMFGYHVRLTPSNGSAEETQTSLLTKLTIHQHPQDARYIRRKHGARPGKSWPLSASLVTCR
jgi:hypothetical protein